jgi:hypothetical protein
MRPPGEWSELGQDELDVISSRPPRFRWLPYRRRALGTHASALPTLLFIVTGAALGPEGLNVLTDSFIAQSQALVWVGLAVIGVFVGLGLAAPSATPNREVLPTAAVIALMTIGVLSGGFYILASQSLLPLSGHLGAGSVLVALCASVSASIPTSAVSSRELLLVARLADIDDLPLLAAGIVVLATLTGGSGALRVAATVIAGGAIGLAGGLLFSRATPTERGLFATGALLLLAGIGAYLGTSPLVSGCAAAVVWSRVPRPADRITAEDLRALQHPLIVLILIFVGAAIEATLAVLWAAALIVVLRLAAKLLVSVVALRIANVSPSLLASILLQPGVLGVAMALNAWMVLGNDYRWIVSAVSIATITYEVLALFLPPIGEVPS